MRHNKAGALVRLLFAEFAVRHYQSEQWRAPGDPDQLVPKYFHSRGSACRSYYPDLTGNVDPGAVELVLDIEWQ